MRGTFFLTTVPQSTEKSERRKLFFSDFPTTTRACVGAFPFFSTQHSVVAHVIFLFTCCLILLLSTFFSFFLPLTTLLSLSPRFSQTPSLSLSHSLTNFFNVLCYVGGNILHLYCKQYFIMI